MEEYQIRIQKETEELATKVNKLQDFMRTRTFYLLSRVKKDLMYDQLHAMLTYLQILGKRCELEEIPLFQPQEDFDEHVTHPDFDAYMKHQLEEEPDDEDIFAMSLDEFFDIIEGNGL